MTLLEAINDPNLLGPLFGSSWNAWRAFLAAVYSLSLSDEGLDLYRR